MPCLVLFGRRLFLHPGITFQVAFYFPSNQARCSRTAPGVTILSPTVPSLGEQPKYKQRGVVGPHSRVMCVVMLKVLTTNVGASGRGLLNLCLFLIHLRLARSASDSADMTSPPTRFRIRRPDWISMFVQLPSVV
ncbi:hypothetical protein PAXRUDRAFT_612362 [Paxillus rubicundulus Ve08.2h10]|uniref:Uncharacterized protein n=1 Tax=Paxillus rubicundulus Ve08.2h10 TaxID=930991 RepID=A0A0D0DYM9_9AGAM|nr:hypothetical protein PAXRUDRAFT_612362 [Paxillus rubicundulus Ve08.2h10]